METMNNHTTDDPILLATWLRRGCERSFRLLVERYAGLVHQAARRRSGDETIATEAAQATFILLARKARALQGRTSLAGWLHLTAVHQARNLMRRQMRETRKRRELGVQTTATSATSDSSSAWHDMQPALDQALGQLSAPDREALLLRYYRSLSVREVAATVGVSVDAARKRLTRATGRLRDHLSGLGCALPAAAVTAGLVGFAADARAGFVLAPSLGTRALAAAPAPSVLTLTTLLLMTKKANLLFLAAILLLCLGTYVVQHKSRVPAHVTDAATSSTIAAPAAGDSGSNPAGRKRGAHTRETTFPDLVAKYSDSRIKFCQSTFDVWLSNLDKTLATPKIDLLRDPNKTLLALSRELNLSKEQRAAARAAIDTRQHRLIEKGKALAIAMHEDSRPLIEFLAAGDAFSHQRLSREEFMDVVARADDFVENSGGSTDLLFGAPSTVHDADYVDPDVRAAIENTLDSQQAPKFHEMIAREFKSHDRLWGKDEAPAGSLANFKSLDVKNLNDFLTGRVPGIDGPHDSSDDFKFTPEQEALNREMEQGELEQKQAIEQMLRDDAAGAGPGK